MTEIMVGDKVLVQAEVLEVLPDNVLVELFSKTDQYEAWVREDKVLVALPDVPGEPPNGTWLIGNSSPDTDSRSVFHRDDNEGHNDRGTRRYDRRWWDVAGGEWVDWPEAVRRGANPHTRLIPAGGCDG